eukprot:4808-Ditylum_brightwellii.AAC.1
MAGYFGTGQAEYSKVYTSLCTGSADSDLARDLCDRRSTTSNLITNNNVAIHWKIAKKPKPTDATSNVEIMSQYSEVNRIKKVRSFSTYIGYPIGESSIIYEDNIGTTKSINSEKITPTQYNKDIMIHSVLHYKRTGTI